MPRDGMGFAGSVVQTVVQSHPPAVGSPQKSPHAPLRQGLWYVLPVIPGGRPAQDFDPGAAVEGHAGADEAITWGR